MIYLIGVKHEFQHDGNSCVDIASRNKFSAFLKNKAKEYNVALLAEEFNEDCLKNSKGNISIVKKAAEELKIKHRFCELSKDERKAKNILSESEIYSKKLNIRRYGGVCPVLDENQQKIFDEEMEKSFLAREIEWFLKINDYFDKNILFVCGSDHIESFLLLLNSRQHKVKIIYKNFWEN